MSRYEDAIKAIAELDMDVRATDTAVFVNANQVSVTCGYQFTRADKVEALLNAVLSAASAISEEP